MATQPVAIRFDAELLSLLKEGKRRTPLTMQELVRRTLRLHLRSVIDEEARTPAKRLTNVQPWSDRALAAAYRREKREGWDQIELAAVRGQPAAGMED